MEQAAPANVNRKVIKVKTKAQREKDAEKVHIHPYTPLREACLGSHLATVPCNVSWRCLAAWYTLCTRV